VTNYTFEFTPTSSCSNYTGIGLPFTHTNVARNIPLNFTGATTSPIGQTIQPQSYYIVRVRPNFGVGGMNPGTWGTPRVIFIGGTLMTAATDESGEAIEFEEAAVAELEVYPNPGNGESVQLAMDAIDGSVELQLFDQMGRLVERKQLIAEQGFQAQWVFDEPLSSGLYHIRLVHDGKAIDHKYLVTK
jgi:hypothetical protein